MVCIVTFLIKNVNVIAVLHSVVLSSFYLSPRVDEDEEIIVKAMTDYWVVGKKSDQRELYVILNQKNANLIEVNGTSPLADSDYICFITVTLQYLP